jgi:ribokinase
MSPARDTRVVVVGQIARDIVLRVGALPERGDSGAVSERLEMLGGKGANQAVGLAQLGMSVSLVGAVGGDEAARWLLDQAAADGIDVSWAARRVDGPTGLIVSIVDPGGWRYLEHIPPEMLATPADIEAATPVFRAAGTVVIQLQQPAHTVRAAAELARRFGCRVVLDGAPPEGDDRQRLLALSDVVRADAREAELLTGRPIRSGTDAIAAGREILRQGPTLAALAAGSAGNVVVWPGGSVLIPLADSPVTDTTGGGDAFVAALVAALAHGLSPAQSGRKAAAAAAQTVRHLGGRPRLRRQARPGGDPFPAGTPGVSPGAAQSGLEQLW